LLKPGDQGEALPLLIFPARTDATGNSADCGKWGRLDIAFYNAGINGVWAPWKSLRLKSGTDLNINLKGTF